MGEKGEAEKQRGGLTAGEREYGRWMQTRQRGRVVVVVVVEQADSARRANEGEREGFSLWLGFNALSPIHIFVRRGGLIDNHKNTPPQVPHQGNFFFYRAATNIASQNILRKSIHAMSNLKRPRTPDQATDEPTTLKS